MILKEEKTEYRRGPSPLPVHVGLAVAEYTRLRQAGHVNPDDMTMMLAGIRKYQQHPYRRTQEPLPVAWQQGEVRLFYCAAKKPKASLLVVPSLVNKSTILDLLPDKSFVRWMAEQGVDTYLLDWGNPVRDPSLHKMDEIILRRLCAIIDALSEKTGGPIHALGYCMGGTLLAAAAIHSAEKLCSMAFLASPWDFAAGDQKLSLQVNAGAAAAYRMIDEKGYLSKDWIQSVFAAVNADRAMKKFAEFMAMDDEDERVRLFVAVEDWLNDGIDMPGALAKTCVSEWYGENRPGNGLWVAGGKVVDLKVIKVPALVIASQKDRLVPKESSMAMARQLPQARSLEPASGHIGMMTGRQAQREVWRPVAKWIHEKS